MGNLIMSWAGSHQQFLVGLVAGWASTHPRVIVKAGFKLLMKIPAAESFVKANGPALHTWVTEGASELVSDIDEQAATPAETPKQG
jgi:hypothetical protein